MRLSIVKFVQDGMKIIYSPSLDLYGSGKTWDEAAKNLKNDIEGVPASEDTMRKTVLLTTGGCTRLSPFALRRLEKKYGVREGTLDKQEEIEI